MKKQASTPGFLKFFIHCARIQFLEGVLFCIALLNTSSGWSQDTAKTIPQTMQVSGIIRSIAGDPVPGVSISIEGSIQRPVVTDDSGHYSIMSTSPNNWLIVSPTPEYKMKRIFINNRAGLDIYLTPEDIASGDDPLSIHSQLVARRNMIASYAELNVKDVHHSTALSIDQYMEGRVPGIFVVNRSGDPGSGAYTALRGINTLNASSQPLYVVDGMPLPVQGLFGSNLAGYAYNQLMGINPEDISKMTIVKDPALNTSFGSKGSNGVIFIETLEPSVTQTTIELDLRSGLNLSPSRLIPQMDAEQHKSLMNEVLFSSGMLEEDIKVKYPGLFIKKGDPAYLDYQHNTNWQDLIFSNSFFSNLNLKVKGGDEIARYGLSFGYNNNNGIIKNTNYQGYNLRFVGRLNIFTWLRMYASVSLNANSASLKEAGTVKETSPILASLAKSPLLGPYQYDDQGNQITALSEVNDLGVSNPLAIIQNYDAKNKNYSFVSSVDFEGILAKNLKLRTKLGLIFNVLKEKIFMPNHGMEHYYNMEAINVAKASNNDLKAFFNNTYLSYNKSIGKTFSITSTTGMNIQTNNYQFDWGLTKNAPSNDQYRALQDGQNNLREIGGQNRDWNWLCLYEYASLSFFDKYFLTGNVSIDGSSRIGKDAASTVKLFGQPYGTFYSAGIAWRLSNESFLKKYSWLEDLKLRLSYGLTGNDDIGEATATNYYQAIKFRETVGLYPAVLPNTKLTYETVHQVNGGLDLSLWGNRFTFSIDAYMAQTNNMLIYSPTDAFLGYDFRAESAGKMNNTGIEFNTFWRILDKGHFKWDIQANVSTINNIIKEMPGGALAVSIEGAEIVNKEGAPANSYYGYVFRGVYTTEAEAKAANLVNDKGTPYQAGDAIYADISGPNGIPDGVINSYDKTNIGSAIPRYYGGLNNTFSYKHWTLSAFLQFVSGNKVFNYIRYKNEQMTGLENQSQDILNRWQTEGQATNVPRALWNDPVGNSAFSTRWIEDGSYLRVKNITLSYKIPEKFLSFRNAEFYISISNLFTLSKYLGYDPEFSYSYSQLSQGIDYGQTPQMRQFLAGIKVGL